VTVPAVDLIAAEPLDARFRAFGDRPGVRIGDVGAQGWSVLAGDLPFPLLTLRESALAHNLELMRAWCEARGVSLAPHGKTHLAPQLVRRQLAAGAWGMTAATVHHIAVLRAAGARRVLLANELVGDAEVAWVERQRRADDGLDVVCLVDSAPGVALLDSALAAAGAERPLPVLVELGAPGTRAGCRTDAEARAVVAAVARAPLLELAGVAAWEGSVGADRGEATLAAVDALLDRARELTVALRAEDAFAGREEVIATAGGSAYFDRVAERLRFDSGEPPVRVVLRSGCYLTHDHGHYAHLCPLDGLRPALELWGRVLSTPEPGLAIAGFGKRDAPFDLDLPVPTAVVRRGRRRTGPTGVRVSELNDQHAFLAVGDGDVAVGDVVVCGISHPCTAFDKWSLLPVLDDEDTVIDAVRTFF
jgi:D-serine deaminase-like pyridoxal phosphate-dependent protein